MGTGERPMLCPGNGPGDVMSSLWGPSARPGMKPPGPGIAGACKVGMGNCGTDRPLKFQGFPSGPPTPAGIPLLPKRLGAAGACRLPPPKGSPPIPGWMTPPGAGKGDGPQQPGTPPGIPAPGTPGQGIPAPGMPGTPGILLVAPHGPSAKGGTPPMLCPNDCCIGWANGWPTGPTGWPKGGPIPGKLMAAGGGTQEPVLDIIAGGGT
mmetsp:Transcript_6366/g.14640  ORF Transcript_6366/g.14640 Transcript_6366/m.14640 type:complete len:208 (-) Transcript_6366:1385-2008(-)